MELYGLEKFGIVAPRAVYRNLEPAALVEQALARGEGTLSASGALDEIGVYLVEDPKATPTTTKKPTAKPTTKKTTAVTTTEATTTA